MTATKAWADYAPLFRRLWLEIAHIPGNVAEFGVFDGGNCFSLAEITGRCVWAFDTFTGIPKEDYVEELDHLDPPGKFVPNYDLSAHHTPGIIPVKGRFEETLTWFPGPFPRLAMALVDCDLYLSAKQVLAWLPKHMPAGGIILVDDYADHKGIQKAVHEFLKANHRTTFEGSQIIRMGAVNATV